MAPIGAIERCRVEVNEVKERSFEDMRRVATGLLVVMMAVYVISHLQPSESLLWSYVRAFAEAAMIGGLADWFAVTAIFRRPLGLPIPHTAVIPQNQGRIADALGAFIADNFLSPELVAERVAKQDLAAGLGRWLSTGGQTARLADGIVSAIPPLLDTFDDASLAEFFRKQGAALSTGARIAPAAASVLEALAAQNRHQALIDAALKEAWRWLEANEGAIRARVRTRTGWFWRVFTVDNQAADALIAAIEDLLTDAAHDPQHPLRARVDDVVRRFAEELKNEPAMQARMETMAKEMLAHPALAGALSAAGREIKDALRRDCVSETSQTRAWAEDALKRLGAGLLEDESVRAALNERLRALLVELAARHGGDVSKLVSDTIRGWDTRTMVDKLEQHVGRDLQYIRLNGTIIGGLLGLLLHGLGEAMAYIH
jgi:uncharacterized membrane-anchored protein YjiN (DUF445 family)